MSLCFGLSHPKLGALPGCTLILLSLVSFGCASHQKGSPDHREKIVPDETQRESEQMSGRQQMFMNDLSLTPSEQAGVRHEQAVQSVRDPDEEESRAKK